MTDRLCIPDVIALAHLTGQTYRNSLTPEEDNYALHAHLLCEPSHQGVHWPTLNLGHQAGVRVRERGGSVCGTPPLGSVGVRIREQGTTVGQ